MQHLKRKVDVILIVPLPEEFEACLNYFDVVEDCTQDSQIRLLARIPETSLTAVLIEQRDMGKLNAFRAASAALREFDTKVLMCVGIAAGLSKDANIGDVCYTGTTIDLTENTKVSGKRGRDKYSFSPIHNVTPDSLSTALRLNRILPDSRPSYLKWQAERLAEAQALIPNEFTGKEGKKEVVVAPKVSMGFIACGMVSADPDYNQAVRGTERRLFALETESAGVFEAAADAQIAVINIRGISDFAGADKTLFEEQTNNQARRIAALNAMSYVLNLLGSHTFRRFLDRYGAPQINEQPNLPALEEPEAERFLRLTEQSRDVVDCKLRELAPGYDSQRRGYRLPLPRVRLVEPQTTSAKPKVTPAVDFRTALASHRVLTVQVPQAYPDRSLAWAVAAEVISSEIDGKQLLPIVVPPDAIQRPSRGLKSALDADNIWQVSLPYCVPVFIIDEFDFDSSSRSDFLAVELNEYPDAYCIVLYRSQVNKVIESKFATKTGAADARLAPVPFSAITQFCRQNFDMSAQASEVVASKLYNLFKRFRLTIHPAYFAGVSRDALTSMLSANRRADLIELAVTGYLTYAVSGDLERIRLSGRFRQQFLTEVAYQLRVEKRSLSEAELVSQAQAMATKMDFSIRPSSFISWFEEHGILSFRNGVEFTLPFVEWFLLAKKLSASPSEAKRYFDVNDDGLDHSTFSIYAELGASNELYEDVLAITRESVSELRERYSPVLVNNKARPAFLYRHPQIQKLQRDIDSAKEDVRLGRDKLYDKQKLIDAAERAHEVAAAKAADFQDPAANDPVVGKALRSWRLATSALIQS